MITMNNFRLEYQTIQKEIDQAIHRVLNSGWHILGNEVEQFEKEFSQFLGCSYTIGVANGLEALQIGLIGLSIGPGDEVITTPFSAVATVLAITQVGATPVFADIDRYFHLDPEHVKRKITKKTKAILPVHLYGQSADISSLQNICLEHNIFLLEDAAQAHGATFNGQHVGTFGVFGAFSFYPTKNLGAYGDGGAITTNNAELMEKYRMLRNYGQKDRYVHLFQGINSRLDELQAAILRVKLKHLKKWNMRRNRIATVYNSLLSDVQDIEIPHIRENSEPVFHLYVIKTERRDELHKGLTQKGVASLVHYPVPIHKQQCYPMYNSVSCPLTETVSRTVLSLPIHPFLTDNEVERVCALIRKLIRK